MKSMTAKELERIVLKAGWVCVRQKGSHRIYKHKDVPELITIPFHGKKDLSPGVIKSTLNRLKR